MKRIFFLLLGITSSTMVFPQEKKIVFFPAKNWEELVEKAKSENKLIFMDVYATWCSPCKQMEKEVFSIDSIYNYLNKYFVPVKIQIDKNPSDPKAIIDQYNFAQKIFKKYQIKSVPTYLFIDPNQNLAHREEGYMHSDTFITRCKTAKENIKSYGENLKKLLAKNTTKIDLLQFSLDLKKFNEDSLAKIAATIYKKNNLDKLPPIGPFNPQTRTFLQTFGELFTSDDNIINWMFSHKKEIDEKFESAGFVDTYVNYIIKKDLFRKTLASDLPAWSTIESELSNKWGSKISSDAVLDAKIRWYTRHRDWHNVIKYQMEQIDQNTDPQKKLDFGQILEINNFVYEIVLKKSCDLNILKKASYYMQLITEQDPDNFSVMDTYANVLYKMGQKNKAIKMEEKVLELAEGKSLPEDKKIFEETIKKMKMNNLTWD